MKNRECKERNIKRRLRFMTPAQRRIFVTREIFRAAAKQRKMIYGIKTKNSAGDGKETS